MFIIMCPDCNEVIRLPDDAGGITLQCLRCNSIILFREKRLGVPDYYNIVETKVRNAALQLQSRRPDLSKIVENGRLNGNNLETAFFFQRNLDPALTFRALDHDPRRRSREWSDWAG